MKKLISMVIAITLILSSFACVNVGASETATQTEIFKYGDVNKDGSINIVDVTLIQKSLAGLATLSKYQEKLATVDSWELSVADATDIQKFLANREFSSFIINRYCRNIYDTEQPYVDGNDKESINRAIEKAFMEYVNAERVSVGVQPLATDTALTDAAHLRCTELSEKFSHTRPDGTSCFTAIQNENAFSTLGENIAGSYHSVSSEQEFIYEDIDFVAFSFFNQFKGSSGHYKNMISKNYKYHGVGVSIEDDEAYIAHIFGKKW